MHEGGSGDGCSGERMPSLRCAVAGCTAVLGCASYFLVDFWRRRERQTRKRKRIFHRRVREYVREFNNEVRRETLAATQGGVSPTNALNGTQSTLRERLPSIGGSVVVHKEGEELPFVATQSFTFFRPNAGSDPTLQEVYKRIHVVGPMPGERKLVVRRGAGDEHVRQGMLRLFRISPDKPVTILYRNEHADLAYEQIVDGGIYTVQVEQNIHRRRRTMIMQAAQSNGFRFSVGVDWREVSNMLRKAIEYGESEDIVSSLQELLARHVIERLEGFAADPTKETYSIGKTLEHIERDLQQLSRMSYEPRLVVLEKWRYRGSEWSAKALIDNLEFHMRERNQTGWANLYALLRKSYLRSENLLYNGMSFLLSAGAGALQPSLVALQVSLARNISQEADLPATAAVLFWVLMYSCASHMLQQLSRSMHTRQTVSAVQLLREQSAALMSRADQAFMDTHDVEDILATLEGDIGNIELLLRHGRGWLMDMSRVLGSSRIVACSIAEGSGASVITGTLAGVASAQFFRWLKNKVSHTLDHIPEEEDEVQEYAAGFKVAYAGKQDKMLGNGVLLEVGDEGTVLGVRAEDGVVHCRFAAGELACDEDDLHALEQVGAGPQEVDFDSVWEEDSFRLARQWGRDVDEVKSALAVKDLQMKKQNEFVLVPNIIQDAIQAMYDDVPKFLMLLAALVVLDKFGKVACPSSDFRLDCLGDRLLLLESETHSAITVFFRIQAEMRSLLHDCFVGARRTLHLLDYKPSIDVVEGSQGLSPRADDVRGRISFENVEFAYPNIPHKKVLRGLSFDVEAGSHVAIVGPSGCGKSSIFGLLSRLYDPDGGTVVLDGVNLKNYDVKHMRSKLISQSAQLPYLFDGTLLSNVKYANAEATAREVQRALNISCCDRMVERLPEGTLTVIGGGVRLSGGEQKRIGLARTLLARSRVLLLDEPTAGLDVSTECVIKRNLQQYRKETGTTIITISHTLSFIQDCDKILVVGDPDDDTCAGRLVAQGTHEELMRSCKQYQRLAIQSQVRSPSLSAETEHSPICSVILESQEGLELAPEYNLDLQSADVALCRVSKDGDEDEDEVEVEVEEGDEDDSPLSP
eukprot:Rhum_TRINITY_DN24984_c0_g1::Rhum_TRINITY_DN24984_c0_g1_i1::g.180479::m.180479/K05658/ABCB1, CD243; ATP-binding cassette, subfamily B (MDR/TAP), member 1